MPERPKPAKPMKNSWTTGREKVTELLGRGELEHVEVNPEHAKALINRADKHLARLTRKAHTPCSMTHLGWL